MSARWDFDAPSGVYKNELLTRQLLEYVATWKCIMHGVDDCAECFPPLTPWQRLRYQVSSWIDSWTPRLHFGSCHRDEDCDA